LPLWLKLLVIKKNLLFDNEKIFAKIKNILNEEDEYEENNEKNNNENNENNGNDNSVKKKWWFNKD